VPTSRIVLAKDIDVSKPWGFFDGTSGDFDHPCGDSFILYLSPSHFFKVKMGLGPSSNNRAELLACKICFYLPRNKVVHAFTSTRIQS